MTDALIKLNICRNIDKMFEMYCAKRKVWEKEHGFEHLLISLVPTLFCKKKITDAMWRKESLCWPYCCKLIREKLTWYDCFLLLSFQEIIRRGFELGNDTWWVLTFNSQWLRTLLSLLYLVDCIHRLAHKTKYIYHLLEVVFSEVTVHDVVKYG